MLPLEFMKDLAGLLEGCNECGYGIVFKQAIDFVSRQYMAIQKVVYSLLLASVICLKNLVRLDLTPSLVQDSVESLGHPPGAVEDVET